MSINDDVNNDVTEIARKVGQQYENPVDNFLITLSDKVSPIFKQMNFTPNGLTTLSTIFSAGALYHLYTRDSIEFALYGLMAYFFDVMDGYYARKYNMVTEGGDKYDHYKDIVVLLIGVFIVYSQYNIVEYPVLIVVGLTFCFLLMVNVGCQEVIAHKNGNNSDTLVFAKDISSVLSDMSDESCRQKLNYLKWFGSGMFYIFIIVAVFYMNGEFDFVGRIVGNADSPCGSTLSSSSNKTNVVPGSDSLKISSSGLRLVADRPAKNHDFDLYGSYGSARSNPKPMISSDLECGIFTDADIVDKKTHGSRHLFNQADLEFISDLRNFGSASIGTSAQDVANPYSTSVLIDRLIRD